MASSLYHTNDCPYNLLEVFENDTQCKTKSRNNYTSLIAPFPKTKIELKDFPYMNPSLWINATWISEKST